MTEQQNEIRFLYFDWLCRFINRGVGSRDTSHYSNLLFYLFDIPFTYTIDMDENRAEDGIQLRYQFASEYDISDVDLYLNDRCCSIFEMMIALSIRMEDSIMEDPDIGSRVAYWFWGMIKSLGLINCDDYSFDYAYVKTVINRFLNHDYLANGRGGLFTVENSKKDMRTIEIWYQMYEYVNSIM